VAEIVGSELSSRSGSVEPSVETASPLFDPVQSESRLRRNRPKDPQQQSSIQERSRRRPTPVSTNRKARCGIPAIALVFCNQNPGFSRWKCRFCGKLRLYFRRGSSSSTVLLLPRPTYQLQRSAHSIHREVTNHSRQRHSCDIRLISTRCWWMSLASRYIASACSFVAIPSR